LVFQRLVHLINRFVQVRRTSRQKLSAAAVFHSRKLTEQAKKKGRREAGLPKSEKRPSS
jgi:hypothetical protein